MWVIKLRHVFKWMLALCWSVLLWLPLSNPALASNRYQQCPPDSSCIIGEYLFDDDYQPEASASCTLSAKDPGGNDFLTNQPLTPTADAWYAHTLDTTGLTEGFYRAQICCVVDGDTMCLDKGFQVSYAAVSGSDIASAVWDASTSAFANPGTFGFNLQNPVPLISQIWAYSSRTLTDYGNLVDNIWTYSSRSLSSFGTLITDIWANPTRTLTSALLSSGQLATDSDISTAVTSIKGPDNRDLSQVTTDIGLIQASIATIDTKVTALDTKVDGLTTATTDILAKWGSYSIVDLVTYLDTIDTALGTNLDTCLDDDTVFGNIQCVRDKWGAQSASDIYLAANSAAATSVLIRTELGFSGKTTTAFDEFENLKNYVDTLESSIGTAGDSLAQPTLFGRLALIQDMIDDLAVSEADIDLVLERWGTYSVEDILSQIQEISPQVTVSNSISGVDDILSLARLNQSSLTELMNKLLALEALTQANRVLLEQATNQPIIKVWLENGSIVFRILINNPSSLTSQTVPLKYYLPMEVTREDIIEYDDDLVIDYDPAESRLLVTGEFVLGPKATRTFGVQVADIWTITPQEISSIESQAETLFKPLEGTAYFAQGSLIYNEIKANLAKALQIQAQAVTPEGRIKAFREARVEIDSARSKLDDMKSLVSMAGSNTSFSNQLTTNRIIGLIGMLVGGLLILALLGQIMASRRSRTVQVAPVKKAKTLAPKLAKVAKQLNLSVEDKPKTPPTPWFPSPLLLRFVIVGLVLTATISGLVWWQLSSPAEPVVVIESQTPPTPIELTEVPNQEPPVPQVRILETGLGYLNVRSEAKIGSELISRVEVGEFFEELDRLVNEAGDEWVNIKLDETTVGWVLARYVEKQSEPVTTMQPTDESAEQIAKEFEPSQVLGESRAVTRGVIKIPKDFSHVKVRLEPKEDSTTLHRYWVEYRVNVLEEKVGWSRVEIEPVTIAGQIYTSGWVKSEYIVR